MDPSKLSISELFGRLSVAQLWIVFGALFGVISASFGIGYGLAANLGEVKYQRVAAVKEILELETETKSDEIQNLRYQLKDQKLINRQLEDDWGRRKMQLDFRISRLEVQSNMRNNLEAALRQQ